MREARALGKLSHPNVVQVYDVGEHQGDVFVAMELVDGQAFDAWCHGTPAPDSRAVLAAYLDAARGLAAAHDKGLVHRDVKPSNILRGSDGRVRVVDFGLAAASEASPSEDEAGASVPASAAALAARDTQLTATGAILGTPLYMAPEQYEGLRASPASDQFSLCTALYEGLYGVLPCVAPDGAVKLGEILARKLDGPPATPPGHTSVPGWVHQALIRGLAPRPEDRYPSIAALIAALGDEPRRERVEPVGRVPRQLTPLVGRADEVRDILGRVRTTRLLTLTGAGGMGKSRLAIQVASDLSDELSGGAWFVELAPLADPELVLPTVASVLGVHDAPGRPLFDLLVASLRGRRVLLVLDNCEHVLGAASGLADSLLRACADLTILATSRQSLGVAGEAAWRVPSLVRAEAVALFHERAGQADDPETVAQICRRLDGIPLAIELAAARTRVLSVAQIAARLDDRFRLLTDGSRSALPRHRTLKAAVDWSYQLLTEEEQGLLCRLSVFAGGCTLEAAEAVAGRDVLDPLANLVDKSLVVFSGHYRLLETVRQYAAERLAERGETDLARARHLDHYVQLAEATEPHIFGGEAGGTFIHRLEIENDNLRAALDFCHGDPRRAEAALRLCAAVHWFWFARGQLREAHARMGAALRLKALASPGTRARALAAAAILALWVGEFSDMHALATESVTLARDLGDVRTTGYALCALGAAAVNRGDPAAARVLLAEAVTLARDLSDSMLVVFALFWLGTAEHAHGDLAAARRALSEGLSLTNRDENRAGFSYSLLRLGEVTASSGHHDEARRCYQDSLLAMEESADRYGIAHVLAALGRTAVSVGDPERGARLLGAVEAQCELIGGQLLARVGDERSAAAAARDALGEAAFAAAWSEGRRLSLEQAVAYARGS